MMKYSEKPLVTFKANIL